MVDNKEEKEIDLLELARKLWDNKKFILKVTIIGAILGVIIAFSIPKEYTSTVVFTTNTNVSASNVGALASLAGINLSNIPSNDGFSPELYSDIIKSTPFIREILLVNVKDSNQGIDTTLYSYLKDWQHKAWWTYISSFPSLFTNLIKGNNNFVNEDVSEYYVSTEELSLISILKASYDIDIDKKTKIATFKVTSQSSSISAFLADTLTSFLQSYIISERTKKAKTDLRNSEILYTKAKNEYYQAQKNLAIFIDANNNLISAKYKLNQDKLQNEANLSYSLYNQMAQQVQMNSIRVQDNTPVFTIIQPSIESPYPSSTSKKIIVLAFMLIPFSISCLWLLRKDIIVYFKD